MRLKTGVFWYYLEQIEQAPPIRQESSYPLTRMSYRETRTCAFRVIVYENRVAVELFHSLTDGTGGLIFLKTLLAEYLQQKYDTPIHAGDGILGRLEEPSPEELEDSFLKYAGNGPASRKDTNAWHMSGEPQKDGFLNLTCFQIPVKPALELAHKHNATLTVFMSAVMMKALLNLQNEKNPNTKRQKRIKLLIPVNLRNLFPSNTLRNFAMYTIPELDPRLGAYSFDEICKIIQHKMGTEFTEKHMSCVIATNVNDERNPLVRLIPLPLKNAVMKAVFTLNALLTLIQLKQQTMPQVLRLTGAR